MDEVLAFLGNCFSQIWVFGLTLFFVIQLVSPWFAYNVYKFFTSWRFFIKPVFTRHNRSLSSIQSRSASYKFEGQCLLSRNSPSRVSSSFSFILHCVPLSVDSLCEVQMRHCSQNALLILCFSSCFFDWLLNWSDSVYAILFSEGSTWPLWDFPMLWALLGFALFWSLIDSSLIDLSIVLWADSGQD